MRKLENKSIWRYIVSFCAVLLSAFLQAFTMQVFLTPAQILSSGFTGVAVLIERITSLFGIHFSTSLGMIALNIPVAIFCFRYIGKKFVVFSLMQVFFASLILRVATFSPIFDDVFLNICFGGFLYGLAIVIAIKGNASTAGTDFIALYVSKRCGKSIWQYVFLFNCSMLCIFGALFGWVYAGYSILFQFLSTKTIETFDNRYKRVTLQITTSQPNQIINAYMQEYHHGMSVVNGYGGYGKSKLSLLHTVVSIYEVRDIVTLMREVDPRVIINVLQTETFYGNFYQRPID